MKRALLIPLALVGGLAIGGGAAFGVSLVAPSHDAAETPAEDVVETEFVTTGPVLTPLVFADGRFAGYVAIEAQLEVPIAEAEPVRLRMPLLLHAINMQTFRTPMATGPDGQIPDLEAYRRLVLAAAPKAFGAGVVRRAAITQARPA